MDLLYRYRRNYLIKRVIVLNWNPAEDIYDPFSLSSYLTGHKRNEDICYEDNQTMNILLGLIVINTTIKINTINLK